MAEFNMLLIGLMLFVITPIMLTKPWTFPKGIDQPQTDPHDPLVCLCDHFVRMCIVVDPMYFHHLIARLNSSPLIGAKRPIIEVAREVELIAGFGHPTSRELTMGLVSLLIEYAAFCNKDSKRTLIYLCDITRISTELHSLYRTRTCVKQ